MSINRYIEKKYINYNKKVSGFISGLGLYNKYGFTSQAPSVIEVTSSAVTTKQRKINVDGYDIIVYKHYNLNRIKIVRYNRFFMRVIVS